MGEGDIAVILSAVNGINKRMDDFMRSNKEDREAIYKTLSKRGRDGTEYTKLLRKDVEKIQESCARNHPDGALAVSAKSGNGDKSKLIDISLKGFKAAGYGARDIIRIVLTLGVIYLVLKELNLL